MKAKTVKVTKIWSTHRSFNTIAGYVRNKTLLLRHNKVSVAVQAALCLHRALYVRVNIVR